ncbi:metallophosphoesterase [Streptomyces sp. NPDC005438]|uniref:metallophosphoesterase n=1 Tax=Streptomyces sp. NPDC005438 TaxID=3156880 RepID=UPI0033B7BA66
MGVVIGVAVAVVVVTLMVGAHLYLWRRLVRDVSSPGHWWRRVGTALFFLLPLLTVVTFVGGRGGLPFGLVKVIGWPGYLWMPTLLYLFLALLVGELLRALAHRMWRSRNAPTATHAELAVGASTASGQASPSGPEKASEGGDPPEEREGTEARTGSTVPDRRRFLAGTLALGATAVAGGTVAYGTVDVLDGPTLKRQTVRLAKLPASADGYRLMVVSDLHLSPVLGRGLSERIVETVNRARPDAIVIVGDLVDGTVDDLGPAAAPLARLRAREGVYFVTGNHEYYSGDRPWIDHVRTLGIEPLVNSHKKLSAFDLAGVNDLAGEEESRGPDFERALRGRDRSRALVLLAHQPSQIHEAVKHGVDLQISGHTHGGQVWPGKYLARLANPTVSGLDRYEDSQLFVTRGAGAWGPPVRVDAESDVTLLTLRHGRM